MDLEFMVKNKKKLDIKLQRLVVIVKSQIIKILIQNFVL